MQLEVESNLSPRWQFRRVAQVGRRRPTCVPQAEEADGTRQRASLAPGMKSEWPEWSLTGNETSCGFAIPVEIGISTEATLRRSSTCGKGVEISIKPNSISLTSCDVATQQLNSTQLLQQLQ